ncbi:hypothetical protein [Saccharicrinis fermentans]|uniref:hypothetical protein n=1 Tax=Saccharicrinis fermentans TaxID=982 RepID=UPI0006946FAD|nr:hypothetical protein [Saccharicrinis fermentans]
MLSINDKTRLIQQIINSKSFRKASTSSALLKYLLKAHLNGSYLKEDIIDLEFFGTKAKTDKSTTRVRVSMYNLRKKLDIFYDNEGKEENWRVWIDKGQYELRFEKRQKKFKNKIKLFNKHIVGYSLLIAISSSLIIMQLPPSKPQIWKRFINEETTLFIGDAFGMQGKTITGQTGFTRDYNINSIEEYYQLIETKPELKEHLHPAYYQYFTGMGAYAARDIALLLSPYNRRFDVKFDSNTSLDDIKSGNAIYAGPLLTNPKFISLFNDANNHFKVSKYMLEIRNIPGIKDTSIDISTAGKETDYAIVSKYPGPMGTEHFVFFSNHDMGVSATIEYFTQKDSLKNFSKQHLNHHKYFTALFKAHGRERTSLNLQLLWVFPFN